MHYFSDISTKSNNYVWPFNKTSITFFTCYDLYQYKLKSNVTNILIQEGTGPDGSRGARVVWVLDDSALLVTGFDRYINFKNNLIDLNFY